MGKRERRRREARTAAVVQRLLPLVWRYARGLLGDDDAAVAATREAFRLAPLAGATPGAARAQLLARVRLACRAQPVPRAGTAPRASSEDGLRATLHSALQQLEGPQRESVLLLDVLGLRAEEAAEVMGVTASAAQDERLSAHSALIADAMPGVDEESSADCGDVRAQLLHGDDDADITAHLSGCEACRTHADALDAVRYHLPDVVAATPPGLAETIRDDLGLSASVAVRPAEGGGGTWSRMTRRTPAGVFAAVGGAVVGLVVVMVLLSAPPAADDDAATTLSSLADTHAGQGTSYAFDVSGEVELRLPGGAATPGRRQLFDELDRLADGAVQGAPTRAAAVAVAYRAQGETDGRGALRYELRWRVAADRGADGTVEVATVDGRTWLRTTDGPGWVRTDESLDSVGFDLGVAEVPHHLGEVLATLDEVQEAGTVEVTALDGVPVEHLRARTTGGLVVDAWVGREDGWLRRMRWLPPPPTDDRDGTTHGEVVVRLRDHGRARFVGVPEDWRGPDEVGDEERPPFLPRRG